jgi:hypothetical protein
VTRAANDASLTSFRLGMGIAAALVAIGGTVAAVGIENPRRRVPAKSCPGGQLVGATPDAAGCTSRDGTSPVPAQPAPSTT